MEQDQGTTKESNDEPVEKTTMHVWCRELVHAQGGGPHFPSRTIIMIMNQPKSMIINPLNMLLNVYIILSGNSFIHPLFSPKLFLKFTAVTQLNTYFFSNCRGHY